MHILCFECNDFGENTYLIYDQHRATIIDPGCVTAEERQLLSSTIAQLELTVEQIVLTHAHIDHVLGLKWAIDRYNVPFYLHADEKTVFMANRQIAQLYHQPYEETDQAPQYIAESDQVNIAGQVWIILLTPGHSPGSICLYNEETKQLIAGDVLFRDSIGRTDLPGGDYDTLISSIKNKIYPLPNDVIVYPGHGPTTSVGYEKMNNPFIRA